MRPDTLHASRSDTTHLIRILPAPEDTSGYAHRVRERDAGRVVTSRRAPEMGFRRAPPGSEPDSGIVEKFPRSYPDRLAEAGWITDTDYGFEGLERYVFAPGSPRPPVISLDGFPVDLGTLPLSSFDAWGGEPAREAGAWAPDGPGFAAPQGTLDFERRPAGTDRLLTRLSLHGNDVGGSDALAQFSRHGEKGGWSASAGIRTNEDVFFGTSFETLVEQFRERGLSGEGSRVTGWGGWRAAFSSLTSDLRVIGFTAEGFDTTLLTRREQYRLAGGAQLRDSLLAFSVVLSNSGNGITREGREGVGLRWAPAGLPAASAFTLALNARDRSHGVRSRLGVESRGERWDARLGLENGVVARVAEVRAGMASDPTAAWQAHGAATARLQLDDQGPGSQRLARIRIEPALNYRSASFRAEAVAFLESDRALSREDSLPEFSALLAAPVDHAESYGLTIQWDAPGPLHTRLGGTFLAQHTQGDLGRALTWQPPYSAHAFLGWSGVLPLVPLDAHVRLVGHAEGIRTGADGAVSEQHATADFEAILHYESARFEFGAYNFTNFQFGSSFSIPTRPGEAAPVLGRSFRFGVTWDLWD